MNIILHLWFFDYIKKKFTKKMTGLVWIFVAFGLVVGGACCAYYFFVYRKKQLQQLQLQQQEQEQYNTPISTHLTNDTNNNTTTNTTKGNLPIVVPHRPLHTPSYKRPPLPPPHPVVQKPPPSLPPVQQPSQPICPPGPLYEITTSYVPPSNTNLVINNVANGFYIGINSATGTGNTLVNTDPNNANAAVFQLVPIPSTNYYRISANAFTNLYVVDPDNAANNDANTAAQLSTETDMKSVWKLMLATSTTNICVQNVSTGRVLGAGTETADRLYCYALPSGPTYCLDFDFVKVKYAQFTFEHAPATAGTPQYNNSNQVLTQTGPSAVYTTVGNNGNWIKFVDHSWSNYNCLSSGPACFINDTQCMYNLGNDSSVGRITVAPNGQVYPMYDTCTNPDGTIQGNATASPNVGWNALMNMSCPNCPGSDAYKPQIYAPSPSAPVAPTCPSGSHYVMQGNIIGCVSLQCTMCPNTTNWRFEASTRSCTPLDANTLRIFQNMGLASITNSSGGLAMSPEKAMAIFPEQSSGNTCVGASGCKWCPPGWDMTPDKQCSSTDPRYQQALQENGYSPTSAVSGGLAATLLLPRFSGSEWLPTSCWAMNY
jgi:hypothetical protein